jgi:hypothetical protein
MDTRTHKNRTRVAKCHPDRLHLARGLCESCYNHRYYHEDDERKRKIIGDASRYAKAWYESFRGRAINQLGGECAWCGLNDRRVLCFDHMNGDGFLDREHGRRKDPKTLFKEILAGKRDDIQLLCANCNMRKAHEERRWVR